WVARSQITSWEATRQLLKASTGFFRPVVSLSFALDRLAFGLNPLPFGLTNVALLLGSAYGVFVLARALALPVGAALLASALWTFNWHGINMAVLWISGRTALLLTLTSTLGAAAFLRHRLFPALALVFCAMLSK